LANYEPYVTRVESFVKVVIIAGKAIWWHAKRLEIHRGVDGGIGGKVTL
jgi:hypothetical protein